MSDATAPDAIWCLYPQEHDTSREFKGQVKYGKTLIVMGLSQGNLERLTANRPLLLRHETHPFMPEDVEFLLFTGESEDAMKNMLEQAGIVLGDVEDRR